MIKELCSFMFPNHVECKKELHNSRMEITLLLTQIQELKAVYHYQTMGLEDKVKELELNQIHLLGTIRDLEEVHGKRLEEFHKQTYDLEYELKSLKEDKNGNTVNSPAAKKDRTT